MDEEVRTGTEWEVQEPEVLGIYLELDESGL